VTNTCICGSDLHLFLRGMPGMKSGDVLGHEVRPLVYTELNPALLCCRTRLLCCWPRLLCLVCTPGCCPVAPESYPASQRSHVHVVFTLCMDLSGSHSDPCLALYVLQFMGIVEETGDDVHTVKR
jgi:hypothetical protein